MKEFIRVMKALSDPNRVKILKMLARRELCVCELTTILGLAQPTVSKHLKNLAYAGLVESRKDGLWVNYRLVSQPDSPFGGIMLQHLRGWLTEDTDVREALAKTDSIDRERICGP